MWDQMNANAEEQKKVHRLDVGKWVSAVWHDDEKIITLTSTPRNREHGDVYVGNF